MPQALRFSTRRCANAIGVALSQLDKTDTPTPPNETSNNVGCPRMSRVYVAALDTILQQ
ncbi:hypothetical protein [uncultured Nostoc sp.]|uniref:hypothetical protein n=1 Tax=uncultured Nostoc sp. TaxID=340711 RepID=UPI0035CA6193